MLAVNRKIKIAFVAGIAVVTAGAYLCYRKRKGNCKMECRDQGNAMLLEDIVIQYCDKREHTYITSQDPELAPAEKYSDKESSSRTDKEDELQQPDQMSNVEEMLSETKLMVLKHMFLITEGMTASERLKAYERLARKLKVVERAEGLYDIKWRP